MIAPETSENKFILFSAAGAKGLLPLAVLDRVERTLPDGMALTDISRGKRGCVLLLWGARDSFALGVETAHELVEIPPENQLELPEALRTGETERVLLGVARLGDTGELCCVVDGAGFEGWQLPTLDAGALAAPDLPALPDVAQRFLLLESEGRQCAVLAHLLREIVPAARISPIPPVSAAVSGLTLWRGRALCVMAQTAGRMLCIAGTDGREQAYPVTGVGEEALLTPRELTQKIAEGLLLLCREETIAAWS